MPYSRFSSAATGATFFTASANGPGLGDLRADVHLHAAHADVRHLRRCLVDFQRPFQADAELVLALAGGNVFVPARIHVGVDPQGHGRAAVEVGGDGVDHLQFGLTFNVEGKDALPQRVLDFRPGFADACEGAALGFAAGLQHPEKLARRDDVEAGAFVDEQVEDGKVAVGLDGVADEVVHAIERRVEPAEMVADRPRAVNVEGRTVLGGQRGEIDPLAAELAVVVVEGMHGGERETTGLFLPGRRPLLMSATGRS